MKRKAFLQTITGSAAALAAGAAGWVVIRGSVRIRPLNPDACGASFLAFCERAKFATAEEAVQVAARRGQAFELFLDGDASAAEILPLKEAKTKGGDPVEPLAQPRPDGRALDKLKTASNRIRRTRNERGSPQEVVLSMSRSTGAWARSLAQALDSSPSSVASIL
jgi:hypothetical protein